MDLGSSSYAALVDAIMNAKPAPKPADTGVIYNPQAMERQRFEEHTGYDPTVSDLQNLIAAWKGNKILDAPIPGANPEVGTPGDAMVGALTGAMSKSGSASNPLADILGQTAGGGSPKVAPGGRTPPSPPEQRRPLRASPEERRIKKQIVEIDRRIAESDRRLKDRGLSGREPTSARYETPVDKQVREIREAMESKPSPNRLAEMIQIANENSLKTQVKPAPNQMAIDALHEAMLKRND